MTNDWPRFVWKLLRGARFGDGAGSDGGGGDPGGAPAGGGDPGGAPGGDPGAAAAGEAAAAGGVAGVGGDPGGISAGDAAALAGAIAAAGQAGDTGGIAATSAAGENPTASADALAAQAGGVTPGAGGTAFGGGAGGAPTAAIGGGDSSIGGFGVGGLTGGFGGLDAGAMDPNGLTGPGTQLSGLGSLATNPQAGGLGDPGLAFGGQGSLGPVGTGAALDATATGLASALAGEDTGLSPAAIAALAAAMGPPPTAVASGDTSPITPAAVPTTPGSQAPGAADIAALGQPALTSPSGAPSDSTLPSMEGVTSPVGVSTPGVGFSVPAGEGTALAGLQAGSLAGIGGTPGFDTTGTLTAADLAAIEASVAPVTNPLTFAGSLADASVPLTGGLGLSPGDLAPFTQGVVTAFGTSPEAGLSPGDFANVNTQTGEVSPLTGIAVPAGQPTDVGTPTGLGIGQPGGPPSVAGNPETNLADFQQSFNPTTPTQGPTSGNVSTGGGGLIQLLGAGGGGGRRLSPGGGAGGGFMGLPGGVETPDGSITFPNGAVLSAPQIAAMQQQQDQLLAQWAGVIPPNSPQWARVLQMVQQQVWGGVAP